MKRRALFVFFITLFINLITGGTNSFGQETPSVIISQGAKIDSLVSSAKFYLKQSQPDKSVSLLFEAIQSNEIGFDSITLCKILLSEAYRQKLEYDKGKEMLFTIIEDSTTTPRNRAFAYNRLAALFSEAAPGDDKHVYVIKYSNRCIKISEKNGFDDLKYLSFNELGFSYYRLKDTALSRKYLEIAYHGFVEIGDIENAMNTAINLSNDYMIIHKPQLAMQLIDTVITMGNPGEQKNHYMRLYLQKAKIYKSESHYKQAYFSLHRARVLQRDYYHDRINRQINEMSAAYDLQLKEVQLKEAKQQAKIERQQNYFLIIVVIGMMVLLIVMFLSFQLRRKYLRQKRELIKAENENLKKDLEFKNKELTANALYMAKQMECNVEISEKLKDIMPLGNAKVKQELISTIKTINSKQNNIGWEEFDKHFSSVHEEFYNTLRKNYPDLTTTELKTCAFLKLKMNTKDIASLTNRSPRTIENTRQSIRKKLGIDKDINLISFLLDL